MESITNTMTVSEIRGFIARLMVKADDVKRQKELISKLERASSGQDAEDLDRVVHMLDNELCQTREAIREVKAIYHNRRVAQLDANMK
tara:strand:+ start:415 stop:678 length:264 start_codon:yes stop_codon:yes gene_type:complete